MIQKEHFPVSPGSSGFHLGATRAFRQSWTPERGGSWGVNLLVLKRETWYIEKILRKDTDAKEDYHTLDRQEVLADIKVEWLEASTTRVTSIDPIK